MPRPKQYADVASLAPFGRRLRERLRHAPWIDSWSHLAKLADVSHQVLRRYESGERVPPIDTVARLAAVLQCTIADLWPEHPGEREPPYPAWRTFVTEHEPTDDERQVLASIRWPKPARPTVESYAVFLHALRHGVDAASLQHTAADPVPPKGRKRRATKKSQ